MTNPFQSIPNAGDFQDPLGFIKKLWGDVQIPGMVTPTVSVEELDQKIKDLKAVESWLTLNMNMLRGSIQALEVQRSTIVALQEMGKSFAKNVAMPTRTDFSTATSATKNTDHVKEEGTPQATSAFEYTKNADVDTNKVTEEEADKEAETDSETDLASESVTNSANVSPTWAMPAEAHTWWNVVQDQFKQALNKVMVSDEHNATEDNNKNDKKMVVKLKTKTKAKPKKATSKAQKNAPNKTSIKKIIAVNVASKATSKAAKKPTLKAKASIAKKQTKTATNQSKS